MNARTIIVKYLVQNAFDGLCNDDCGCGINDIAPCECLNVDSCVPAYLVNDDGIDQIYSEDKPCAI